MAHHVHRPAPMGERVLINESWYNKLDDDEYHMRQLARHYVLIATNAGLRTGEQQQLRWCDVKMRVHAQGHASWVHTRRDVSALH